MSHIWYMTFESPTSSVWFFPQILQIFYKFKLTYLVIFLSGDSTANQFGGKKRMFWLNLLFEYISTFFLQFTAALVWGFSFSHSSLGPLKASLPAAPPHSPAWRWLRTHTYLPPLSVFPLEKKGLLNSAFQPYQSSFWNLLLWDDSWKKWHTDCERRFWQVTTLPHTHIWEVLKSF